MTDRLRAENGDDLTAENGDHIVWQVVPTDGNDNRITTETERALLTESGEFIVYEIGASANNRAGLHGADHAIIHAVFLVDIQLADQVLRVSNASKKITINNYAYLPFGGALSMTASEEAQGAIGKRLSLVVADATPELQAAAIEQDLSGRDIRIRLALSTDGGINFGDNIVNFKIGKISQAIISAGQIALNIYTPIMDATRIARVARRWSEDQQLKFVDNSDTIFQWAAESSDREIKIG